MVTEQFQCLKCPHKPPFPSRGRYNRHLKTHSKPFECDRCERRFGSRPDLIRHTHARHRLGQERYACGIETCSHKATRKDNLREHISKVHSLSKDVVERVLNVGTSSLTMEVQQKAPQGRTKDTNSLIEKALETTPTPDTSTPSAKLQQEITIHDTTKEKTHQVKMQENTSSLIFGPFPILQAANAGNIEMLERAVSFGMDISTRGDDGSTALHCAARAGHATLVNRLLDLGASLESQNYRGRNPLHEAILGQNSETVSALLQRDANVHAWDSQGKTAFQYTLELGKSDLAKLFVQHLSDGRINEGSSSLLHIAAKVGHAPITELLLSHPAIQINERGVAGNAPLHLATKYGCKEVVELLLSREGININIRGQLARTPLHYAAKMGHQGVVSLLLTHKDIAIHRIDFYGCAAVNYAIENGHPSIAQLLLEDDRNELQTLDANERRFRSSVLVLAASRGYSSIGKILLKKSSVDINLQSYVHFGMDINLQSYVRFGIEYMTPLDAVTVTGDLELMDLLLKREEININICGPSGTPLHTAAKRGNVEATKRLLQRKEIDPNCTDCNRCTPLQSALLCNHVEVAKFLLEHERTDINAPGMRLYGLDNHEEGTALDIARINGQTEIIEILESRGALSAQEHTAPSPNTVSEQQNPSSPGPSSPARILEESSLAPLQDQDLEIHDVFMGYQMDTDEESI